MKPYQNILVGINYTDASRHALRKAGQIARRTGGELTAYHVIPSPGFDEYTSFYSIEHAEMFKAAKSSLESFVDEVLGENHNVQCLVREGVPHHEVVSYANDCDIDLIILGDDDYAENPRRSAQFAIKTLRFATMPVLLVNRPEQENDHTVSACVDFSKSTDSVLHHAANFANINGGPVEINHVCSPPWLRSEFLRYQTEVFEDEDQKAQFREILEGQITAIATRASKTSNAEILTKTIEAEHPVNALIEHLSPAGRGLVVIGRTGKGLKGIVADFLGGTTEVLIRHARHPILVIPILD